MIIRTHYVKPAATSSRGAARLSSREQRRLENTKHPQKKQIKDIVTPAETDPFVEVELRVFETKKEEQIKEEIAVDPQIEDVPEQPIAKPGTAIIRSKVMDELSNTYKKDPDKIPKKKYKVISIKE